MRIGLSSVLIDQYAHRFGPAALDVFNEFEDAELYESLRRVALIPAGDEADDGLNENVFRNL